MAKFSKINGLPVLKAVLEDERDGIIRVSLVDDPAVMSDFQAFAEQKEKQLYSVTDEDQHLVRGVVMRADFPIFRRSSDGYEFYMLFTPEVVREMAQKYLTEGRCDLVNLMHEEGTDVSGVHLVQWYLKDSAAGVNPEGFEDIADGSLFSEYKVENAEVWDAIKAGTYKGFSLEGYFGLEDYEDQKAVDAIVSELNGKFSKLTKKMGNLNKIKAALKELLAENFGSMATDKGVLSWEGDEEEIKVGDAVSIVAEDGTKSEAADGEYTGKDGIVVVVEGGKVTEIRTPEADPEDGEGEGAEAPEGEGTEAAEEKEECAETSDDEVESPDGSEEGDGDAIEGLRKEVDEIYKIIDGILKVVGETRDSIEKMSAKLAKVSGEPAAKPAHEAFQRDTVEVRSGRAANLASYFKK